MRRAFLRALSVASLLAAAGQSVPAAANEAELPVRAEFKDTGWAASVIWRPDGVLQGTAMMMLSAGDGAGGPRTAWLVCVDDHWSVGFVGTWGSKWDRLVTWADAGEFVDENSLGLIEDSPIVIYKVGQAVAGRADWALGNIRAGSAPTVVFWTGRTKVMFQVGLGPVDARQFVNALRSGGSISVTLGDGAGPWFEEEVPSLGEVVDFFLENGCGSPLR